LQGKNKDTAKEEEKKGHTVNAKEVYNGIKGVEKPKER